MNNGQKLQVCKTKTKKLRDLWRTGQKLPPQNFVNFKCLSSLQSLLIPTAVTKGTVIISVVSLLWTKMKECSQKWLWLQPLTWLRWLNQSCRMPAGSSLWGWDVMYRSIVLFCTWIPSLSHTAHDQLRGPGQGLPVRWWWRETWLRRGT